MKIIYTKEGGFVPNERTEKRREFIINTAYFALVAVLVFLCFKYVLNWIMPFFIGFLLAFAARPAVKGLSRLTKMNRKLAGVLVIILEYALIVVVVWGLGAKIADSLKNLFTDLPAYYDNSLLPFFYSITSTLEDMASRISPETLEQIYAVIENAADSIRDFVLNFSSNMLSGLAGITKKIPFFFISFVFTILASIFISMDYKSVMDFLGNQLPPRARIVLGDAKKHIGRTVLGYLRAYTIIWVITFTELSVGLFVLGIENAIGIAALIAIADILPVIGTGGILIPWAIVALITGNYFLAVGLVVLYVIVLAVRNFTEPKIIGDQLGLNPLVTLLAIYVGYRLLGFFGMILFPVTVNILVGLQKSGKIKLWKEGGC